MIHWQRHLPQHRTLYRSEDGIKVIDLRLRDTRQLFNNLDPAPFHEKDLDAAAEQYITDSVRELGSHTAIKLVVHLPAVLLAEKEAQTIPHAIQHYFAYRAEHARLELRATVRAGFISLLIGMMFLALCLAIRTLLSGMLHDWRQVFAEGLLILGWVAMWRPTDLLLYEWWPILQRESVLRRIATLQVALRGDTPQELF